MCLLLRGGGQLAVGCVQEHTDARICMCVQSRLLLFVGQVATAEQLPTLKIWRIVVLHLRCRQLLV